MKKVVRKSRTEICEYYCDKHPTRECFTQLELSSWYGSRYDLNCVTIHLCDQCVKEMYELLEKEFKVKAKVIEI
jgi:hypothetical protein